MIYIDWMEDLIKIATGLINMIKITFTLIFPSSSLLFFFFYKYLNSTSLPNYTCVYIVDSDKM